MKTPPTTGSLSYQLKQPAIRIGDVGIGLGAAVATVLLSAVTPGSFNFATPWVFWAVVVLFVAGASRRLRINENIWLRAIGINLSWFVLVAFLLRGKWWAFAPVLAGTILPTVGGIVSRRLVANSRY